MYTDEEYAIYAAERFPGKYDGFSAAMIIKDMIRTDPSEADKLINKNSYVTNTSHGQQTLNTSRRDYNPTVDAHKAYAYFTFREAGRGIPEFWYSQVETLAAYRVNNQEKLRNDEIEKHMLSNWEEKARNDQAKAIPYPSWDDNQYGPEVIKNFFREHEMFGYKGKPGDRNKSTVKPFSQITNQTIPAGMVNDEQLAEINQHHDELSGEYEEFHKAAMARTLAWYHDAQATVIQEIQDDPRIAAYALWMKDNPYGVETFSRQTWDQQWDMATRAMVTVGPTLAQAMIPGTVLRMGGAGLRVAGGALKTKKALYAAKGLTGLGNASMIASEYVTVPWLMSMEGGSFHRGLTEELLAEGYKYEEFAGPLANGGLAYSVVSGAILEPLQLNNVLSYMRAEKTFMRQFTKAFVKNTIGRMAKKKGMGMGATNFMFHTAPAFVLENVVEGGVEALQFASEFVIGEALSNSLENEKGLWRNISEMLLTDDTYIDIYNDPELWESFYSATIGFGGPKLAIGAMGNMFNRMPYSKKIFGDDKWDVKQDGSNLSIVINGEDFSSASYGSEGEATSALTVLNNSLKNNGELGLFEYEPGTVASDDKIGMKLLLRQLGIFGNRKKGGKGKNFSNIFFNDHDEKEHGKPGIIANIMLEYGKNNGGSIYEILTKAYKATLKKNEKGSITGSILDDLGLDSDQIFKTKDFIGRHLKIQIKKDILNQMKRSGLDSSDTAASDVSSIVDKMSNESVLDAEVDKKSQAKLEELLNKGLKEAEIQLEVNLASKEKQLSKFQSEAGDKIDSQLEAQGAAADSAMEGDAKQQKYGAMHSGKSKATTTTTKSKPQMVIPKATDQKVATMINSLGNTIKTKGGEQGARAALLKQSNTMLNKIGKALGIDVKSLLETGNSTDKVEAASNIVRALKGASGAPKGPSKAPEKRPGKTKKVDKKADDLSDDIAEIRSVAKHFQTYTKDRGPFSIAHLSGQRKKLRNLLKDGVKTMNMLEQDAELDSIIKGIQESLATTVEGDKTLTELLDEFDNKKTIAEEISEPQVLNDIEAEIFAPIKEFFEQFGITLVPSKMATELHINLAEKIAELDPNNLEQISSVAAAYLTEMLSYHDSFYEIFEEVKKTEWYLSELNKIPEGDRTTSAKRQIIKRVMYDLLNNKFHQTFIENQKDKSIFSKVIAKLKNAVKKLIKQLKGANWKALNATIEDIVSKTMKGKDFFRMGMKKGYVKVDFQKAFNSNTVARKVYEILLTNPKILLTGSLAYAPQGTVYRVQENMVHDLDMVNSMSIEEGANWIKDNFPNSVNIYDFWSKNGQAHTNTWIIPDTGHTIQNLERRMPEPGSVTQTKKVISYDIVDSNNKVVGTYRLTYDVGSGGKIENEKEIKTGEQAILVDFFTDKDQSKPRSTIDWVYTNLAGETVDIKLSHFKEPFDAKLQYSRFKDIYDYNRFVPYTPEQVYRAKFVEAFIQQADVLEKIVIEDIQEYSYTDYGKQTSTLTKTEINDVINDSEDPLSGPSTDSKIISQEAADELNDKKGPCKDEGII